MVAGHNDVDVHDDDEWASKYVCSELFAASCFLGRAVVVHPAVSSALAAASCLRGRALDAPPANVTLCVSSLANEALAEVVT